MDEKYCSFYILANLHILPTRFSILQTYFLQFTDLKDDFIKQKITA